MEKGSTGQRTFYRKRHKKPQRLLSEGENLVEKRIKLIMLAERHDWTMVNEYISDNLVSESDDKNTYKSIHVQPVLKAKNVEN